MEQERPSTSAIVTKAPSKPIETSCQLPVFPLTMRPLPPTPRYPLFPLASLSNWPMMVAANLNWMLAFHQRQHLFTRPTWNNPRQILSCSSQPSQSFLQTPPKTKTSQDNSNGWPRRHSKKKVSSKNKAEPIFSNTRLTDSGMKILTFGETENDTTMTKEITIAPPNEPSTSPVLAVGTKSSHAKYPFSVYSVFPTAVNNIAGENIQMEGNNPDLSEASGSSALAFQAVLYDGEQELSPEQTIVIPSDLLGMCHKSTNPSEVNYCPSTSTVLRRIRRGEELVVLRVPHAIELKTTEKEKQKKKADKSSSSKHLVKNLLKPVKSYRQEDMGTHSNCEADTMIGGYHRIDIEAHHKEIVKEEKDHEKLPGYQCQRCGKMFSYAYYRDKHLKYTRCVDNGDRKFPCPLCSRSFEKRDRLRIHVLHVHENHRPHVCSVCTKAFSQSSSLNKHLRVHSGERPYHCPHCTKAFTASSILRTHIRQHSGEKPFKCAFCGKSFASHAAHDSHVRRTHTMQA